MGVKQWPLMQSVRLHKAAPIATEMCKRPNQTSSFDEAEHANQQGIQCVREG